MADFIDITLVANAGVLVEHGGTGLLVDGIHRQDGHPFSMVSESDLELMRLGGEPFANLDYLLFTHEHPDHFTAPLVLEHVRQRPVRGMFLPDEEQGSAELGRLFGHVREQGIFFRSLNMEPGQARHFALGYDLMVTAICARHMGPQYQDIRNYCFLLSLGGMNVLFTGDGDHVAQYYELALRNVALDAVFVNPIFYHNPAGQVIINEIFRPRQVVVYHMPFAGEDTLNLEFMVGRDLSKYARPGIRTHVLGSDNRHIRVYPASSEQNKAMGL